MTNPLKREDTGTDDEGASESLLISMSPEGFEAFVGAIEAPATPVPEMSELFRRKTAWETGSG
jgi:uncharacterized protein (DUF1778 family)